MYWKRFHVIKWESCSISELKCRIKFARLNWNDTGIGQWNSFWPTWSYHRIITINTFENQYPSSRRHFCSSLAWVADCKNHTHLPTKLYKYTYTALWATIPAQPPRTLQALGQPCENRLCLRVRLHARSLIATSHTRTTTTARQSTWTRMTTRTHIRALVRQPIHPNGNTATNTTPAAKYVSAVPRRPAPPPTVLKWLLALRFQNSTPSVISYMRAKSTNCV